MDKVKKYIDANKDRFISELFDLLRIPSISAQSEHRPDMTRCAEWLAAALVKAGADHAEVFPTEGNPVVYAEKTVDPKAKTVLVYGHYDVMPVDPRSEWRTEPFEPVIRDGRIWSRGADDDKGQLWMHAKAFEAMCAEECLPCNVKFMLEGAESLQILRAEQKDAQGRYYIGIGHFDDLDADPLHHLRLAGLGLHGGRGDGTRQGPAFGAVRRCGRQSRQRADAPCGAVGRC